MEIERKYLIRQLPDQLSNYPCLEIEQAYLNVKPVIRIRRQDDLYYLTYKGDGMIAREEYNLPLNKASYEHLLHKADGNVMTKKRYLIPHPHPAYRTDGADSSTFADSLMIELDIFDAPFAPLMLAEVEFSSQAEADAFIPPEWLGEDVSLHAEYHNSTMSRKKFK